VLDLGLVVLVDGDAAAVVGFKAGGGQVEVVDRALAADGVEQRVAGDLLLAFRLATTVPSGSSSTLSTSSPRRMVTRASRRW
jgi:hydrogenase maturation factor HypE